MSLPRPVWIVDGVRTPIGRYGGALASVRTDDLGAIPHQGADAAQRRASTGQPVDDVIYGCANQAGEDNRNVARMARAAGRPAASTCPARRSTACAARGSTRSAPRRARSQAAKPS